MKLLKSIFYYYYLIVRKVYLVFFLNTNSIKIVYILDNEVNNKKQINNKLDWYLPHYKVDIITSSNFKVIRKADLLIIPNIDLIKKPTLLFHLYKCVIVDPNFLGEMEVSNWNSIFYWTLTNEKKKIIELQSKTNFNNLLNNFSEKAIIFGTGKSIENFDSQSANKDAIVIICNSIIKNRTFLEKINPKVLTIADPLFHFGHSSYAQVFRKDMLWAVKKFNLYLCVPYFNAPLILEHYPSLAKNLIGFNFTDRRSIPSENALEVKGTENILSLLMLPIACSIANKIYMVGMDGKKKGEDDYFWKHHEKFQYVDLLQDCQNEHPSFFNDRNYEQYFRSHSKEVKEFMNWGGKKNKVFYSFFPSNIPGIQEKYLEYMNSTK